VGGPVRPPLGGRARGGPRGACFWGGGVAIGVSGGVRGARGAWEGGGRFLRWVLV
jgi:hypothetical protein